MADILKKILSHPNDSTVIIHITDTYFLKESKIEKEIDLPGFARIYGIVELLAKKFKDKNILFLHSGDFLFPSFLSNHFKGKQIVDILNKCNLKYCTLGNHDFDGGPKVLKQRISESKFNYIITNLTPPKNISKNILQYDVWPKTKSEIAIIGISGKMTAKKASENGFKIKNLKESIHDTIDEIKKKFPKIKFLVALSHMGDSEDLHLKKTLNNLWPGSSVIFGGHDHSQVISYQKSDKCMLVKGQSNARTMQLVVLENTIKEQDLQKKLYILGAKQYQGIQPSPKIKKEIEVWFEKLKKQNKLPANKIIKKFPDKAILDGTELSLRKGTTNLGNFITDCLKEYTGADIAVINSGHFRSDRLFLGKLRFSDLIYTFVLKQGGKIIVTELSKKECNCLLKHAYNKAGKGKILQFSKNTLEMLKNAKTTSKFKVALVSDMLLEDEDGFGEILAQERKVSITKLRESLRKDILKDANLIQSIVKVAPKVNYDPKTRLKIV